MRLTPRPIRRGGRGRGGRESSRSPGADSFLLVVDVPVIMPQIQFIHRRLVFLLWRRDKYPQYMLYLICPLWCFDRCFGSMVQKTVVFPQLQFITVVDTPFVAQMLISMVLATMENPQLRVDRAVDAPVMQVVQFRSSSTAPCIWQSLVRCSVFAVGVRDCGIFCEISSEWFPYATLLGSTVDTWLASVYEAFSKNFTRFLREDIPVVVQLQIPLVRLS